MWTGVAECSAGGLRTLRETDDVKNGAGICVRNLHNLTLAGWASRDSQWDEACG